MNAAQHGNAETREILPAALLDAVDPIPGDAPVAVAPGVVLVPAAGHTPGSQLVYVLTADGRELLFVGDVAWHMDAIRNLHYRPRLVTDWLLDEDRAAVLAQFRTLHELLADPAIQIVVSHDADQRIELVRAGVLGDGLE
jgi:glyoxylase-like metal-dependent hydrolase (beta-lactamase superfamily II)